MLVEPAQISQATGQNIRAACYCRISSDPSDKREGVDRQREDTSALCEVKGWTPAAYYIDNDRSASSGKERPEWERLLADVKAGRIDAIAAWDQDRGWRMMHELESLRRFFTGLGREIKLATTGQGDIDLYSPTGVLAAQIKTAVSEHEIAMMRVRQRRAARQKAEQGRPKWRRAFGYLPYTGTNQDDDGVRHLDPVTAPLVAEAYQAIIAGASLKDICRLFNDAGAYGSTGKPWTSTTLSLFLRKPRNAGLRSHTDTATGVTEIVGKGTWPGIVDEATWRSAQYVLNAPGRAPGRKTVRRHLLTGVLRCGKCAAEGIDARMGGQVVVRPTGGQPGRIRDGETRRPKGTVRRVSYICKQCRGCAISAEHTEAFLVAAVGRRLAEPDAVDLLRADVHDEADAERLRLEKANLYTRLDEIAIERAQGLMDGQQMATASGYIKGQIAAIEAQERDAERVRVFDGIPLGTEEAIDAVNHLSPDRFRAVLSLLGTVTIAPVGRGGKVFNDERIGVDW